MDITQDQDRQLAAVAEVTAWLQYIYDVMDEGESAIKTKLTPDPFYARNSLLTKDIVEQVIKTIEFEIFEHEIVNFSGYHNAMQNISPDEKLVRPGFTELPYDAKLCLVQGVDKVLQGIRAGSPQTPSESTPSASGDVPAGGC